ncbi:acetate kinase [Actinokineospora sp. PR83]|uniref:acetate kinase n=1 Tax=Actinokineospora sp. PR83 TaxID=2884908 RepID=UPI001F478814|nr:acetate kinase [Actinokineospora sp. PR83]MCG8917493.1 acetate kinase [Actinokineospora sp. PR83]
MTRYLTVNPGSSSLKLAVIEDDRVVEEHTVDGWLGESDPLIGFARHAHPDAAAVRIVHGGDRPGPTPLTTTELDDLARYVPLAPLHQPIALRLARDTVALLAGTPVHGCYDTSFHLGLPARARLCALPRGLAERHGIRRHGFHGLSVAHAVRRAAELLGRPVGELRLVVAHIGSGVSVTAVDRGRSVDTTMGFSPLEGLPGTTRSGSLDPAVVLHLLSTGDFDIPGLRRVLVHQSGLAGLSGTDGDVRTLLGARAARSVYAAEALDLYTHRIAREIAAARVSLDGLDALVLTGGVAEHQPGLCRDVLRDLGHLGLPSEPPTGERVVECGPEAALLVVPAREDLEMVRQIRTATSRTGVPA